MNGSLEGFPLFSHRQITLPPSSSLLLPPPLQVGADIVQGIKWRHYAITTGFDGFFLNQVTSGMDPIFSFGGALLQVLAVVVVVVVMVVVVAAAAAVVVVVVRVGVALVVVVVVVVVVEVLVVGGRRRRRRESGDQWDGPLSSALRGH